MNPGYIYILQNPSFEETRLKIGRTNRDPETRAAEISNSTGVPTPFEVAWYGETTDCIEAESILHHLLIDYRTSSSREFFDLELEDGIRAAQAAIRQAGQKKLLLPPAYTYSKFASYPGYKNLSLGERVYGFVLHHFFRPILRLPVEILILLAFLTYLACKSVGWLTYGVVRLVLYTVKIILGSIARVFGGSRHKRRRRN